MGRALISALDLFPARNFLAVDLGDPIPRLESGFAGRRVWIGHTHLGRATDWQEAIDLADSRGFTVHAEARLDAGLNRQLHGRARARVLDFKLDRFVRALRDGD